MFYEKKPVSDHILIPAFPAEASKGGLVVYGALRGFADCNTGAGEEGSIDIGTPKAVFQIAAADITGSPAAGSILYITSAGALTMTATSNTAFATIIRAGAESVDIVLV
jgi:hypothetical protein